MHRNIHIVPHGRDWAVKQEGVPAPLSVHRTQAGAQSSGRTLAQAYQGELVIHRRDGRIRDKDSFGNDPFPPRDLRH